MCNVITDKEGITVIHTHEPISNKNNYSINNNNFYFNHNFTVHKKVAPIKIKYFEKCLIII